MSDPTIRLPLFADRDGIWNNDGTGADPQEVVSLVNSQAEHITKLERALIGLIEAEWMVTHDWGGDREAVMTQARAALDKAGKET